VKRRLPVAKSELEQAKRVLAAVEDAARRDGVASGQLY
jgi:citrate lyase beta subunit